MECFVCKEEGRVILKEEGRGRNIILKEEGRGRNVVSPLTKGLSPLVSTVLLIVMVVAIAAYIISWTGSFVKETQTTVSNRTSEAVDCSGASITIQDIYLTNGTSGSARAIVKNDGFVDGLVITSGQLFNSTGGNFSANNTPIYNFNTGSVEVVHFRGISVPACSSFSQVIITTNCGGISDVFKRAPIC